MTSDYEYEEQECYFAPGSQLVLYSDGVSEAQNEQSRFYKVDRFFNFIANNADLAPRELVENVIANVDAFVGGAEQSDDLTVMSFRFKSRTKSRGAL